MSSVDFPVDLEEWARRTVSEAPISERVFAANLPRIGALGREYGFETLREVLVTLTAAGFPFGHVLTALEPGGVLRAAALGAVGALVESSE